jgi:hypothetical protein
MLGHPEAFWEQFHLLEHLRRFLQDIETRAAAGRTLREPVDLPFIHLVGREELSFMPGMAGEYCVGGDVFSTVLAWNTKTYGNTGPQSWADFWDVKKFPGKRSYRKNVAGALEPRGAFRHHLDQEAVLPELSSLRHDYIDGHEGIAEAGDAKIFVVKAVVDLGEIAEQGVTFRHWFATHLCRGIADYLDIALDGHIAFKDAVKPADDALVAMTQAHESVLIDSKMYAAIGLANGEVIESLNAAQVAVEDPTPLPHGIAVFKKPGGVFKEDHWAYGIRLKDIGKIAADEATKAHGAAIIAVATAKQALEDFLMKGPQEHVLPEFAEEVTRAHDAKARELDEAVLKACTEEKELKAAKAEKTKLAKSGVLEVTLSYTCVIDFADVFHGLRLTRNA